MGIVMLLHDYMRWVLLAFAALVVLKALAGWLGKQPWTKLDNQLGLAYTMALDIQFLLGLIIWLFGTTGLKVLSNVMSNAYGRFIALEHGLLILVALILAHIGRARTKKAVADTAKHRSAFIFYGLSLALIVLVFVMQTLAS